VGQTGTKFVNSIGRAANILMLIKDDIGSLVDISHKLTLSKSTTHRLLKSLEVSGLVAQDPATQRYLLGHTFFSLALSPMRAHENLVICALEQMNYLRELTRESVGIFVRHGTERFCLEELSSLYSLSYAVGKGSTYPLYVGAIGKTILSQLPDKDLQVILDSMKLKPLASGTITDKATLMNEVEKARQQGYAMSFSERFEGSASIAIPVKNYGQVVVLNVYGPAIRFKKPRDILPQLREAADRIADKLLKYQTLATGRL